MCCSSFTYRKHALALAKYEYWYVDVIVDRVEFEVHIELLFTYQIRYVNDSFDAVGLQFAGLQTSFVKHKMRMRCQL